ncbi:MAG: dimethyl sulfoxide reductase anchor subunit family protein [Brooklawnia sp.]|jgi:anaerobic dimethyl sulfoxide reductase subunit C (anchor subunit)
MNLGELPMIAFTVLSQMCVGAFIVLGLVQTIGATRYSNRAIDRLADPALFAIGPALVAGLIASMFHMHDVFNVLNVFRHWDSSWLSREIIFGMLFAGLGFLFFIMQALKLGSATVRRVLALITAAAGVGLVIAQCQIYYSLPTVPAWNSWATWVQFFGTTLLLGALSVAMAFVLVVARRQRREAILGDDQLAAQASVEDGSGSLGDRLKAFFADAEVADAETRNEVNTLLGQSVRAMVTLAVLMAGVLLIAMPLYISTLSGMGPDGQASAAHYATLFAGVRFTLLAVGAFLLGLLAFYYAGFGIKRLASLAYLLIGSFVLVLIGEFMGRALFYEVMVRVGV